MFARRAEYGALAECPRFSERVGEPQGLMSQQDRWPPLAAVSVCIPMMTGTNSPALRTF